MWFFGLAVLFVLELIPIINIIAGALTVAAVLSGRTFVLPDDVKALAGPVLAHRLVVDLLGGDQPVGQPVQPGQLAAGRRADLLAGRNAMVRHVGSRPLDAGRQIVQVPFQGGL